MDNDGVDFVELSLADNTGSFLFIVILKMLFIEHIAHTVQNISTRLVNVHTAALQPATDSDSNDDDDDEQSTASTATTSTAPYPAAAAADEPADCCEVCLVEPHEGFTLAFARVVRTEWLLSTAVPCAVQTSAWSCVSPRTCRLNTDTCRDRTVY